ncbi:MAG TPA: CPBP family intramembrane glutamic endopeptidase [Symbiobacteriaceae bacterium]
MSQLRLSNGGGGGPGPEFLHLALAGTMKVALTYVLVRWLHVTWDRRSWNDLSLNWEVRALLRFATGMATGVLLYGLIQATLWATGSIIWTGALWQLTSWNWTMAKVAGGAMNLLGGAFVEELFFRGYLLQLVRRQYGWGWAAAITSVLFSAMHLLNPAYQGPLAFLMAFLLGCTFVLMVIYHGSLWVPIGLHFAWNYTQMHLWQVVDGPLEPAQGVLVFRSVGGSWLNTGAFQPVGSAVEVLAVLILFSGYFFLYWRGRRADSSLLQPTSLRL